MRNISPNDRHGVWESVGDLRIRNANEDEHDDETGIDGNSMCVSV